MAGGFHLQAVWSRKKGSPRQCAAVTIRRWVPVGLEEGAGSPLIECTQKAGKVRHETQGAQERRAAGSGILQSPQPKLFMPFIKGLQTVYKGGGDVIMPAQGVDAFMAGCKGKEDLDQIFQGKLAVWDDEVRQDGMGMSAAAHDTHDTDPRAARLSFPEIQDVTVVIRMDTAVASAFAARADFRLRAEGSHIFLKKIFR